jgi:IS4 transposase
MWTKVLERFEEQAPASVMARLTLEHALPAAWVDTVFEEHRERQYARELLFSTVVDLVMLASLGLRPSLHAAARQMGALPVSLAALYDKVNHTEPGILRALVRGSSERLAPVVAAVGHEAGLPGWRLRVLDGNHLPASEKRLAPLRGNRGAALPGHTLVVYDPDRGLVTDIAPCEDAHRSERAAATPLLEGAQPGQLWIADRQFCTAAILLGLRAAGADCIVREHARHPRLTGQGEWRTCGRVETGAVREQTITVARQERPWRRIELVLDTPTEAGERVIRLWSSLPAAVSAGRIADLYRTRWRIEGMFQRLESVLHSELRTLGHPRAALLGFAVAVLAYNVLALLLRCVAQAQQEQTQQAQAQQGKKPPPEGSAYHLAVQIRRGYEGLCIAVPPKHWASWGEANPTPLAERLMRLARRITPRQVATSKRGPKRDKTKGYVEAALVRAHIATGRVLAQARATP